MLAMRRSAGIESGSFGGSGEHNGPMIDGTTDPEKVVERQLAAFNAHNLEDFAATYAPTVRYERREGAILRGRDAIIAAHADLFNAGRCRAETVSRLVEGSWVVDHEITHGIAADPVRALVAYRVRDGLIDRVHFLR